VAVLDLFETMGKCGAVCAGCKPHCDAAGYGCLVRNGLAPAIKKALAG
jgi:hypothetical protein